MDELFSEKKFSNQLKWITANRPPSLFFWGLAGWTLEILISG
jgi:hypothetical protein